MQKIATTFATWYAIIFMADLEEIFLEDIELQPHICQRYVDDIFFFCKHGEDSLKRFTETLNLFYRTIKFIAEWSKEEKNFLYGNVRLTEQAT